MNKILNKLTGHFEDKRKLACITAGLFALGILVFIINNTVLFFVDEEAYFWPRLCMKGVTDISWVAGAVLGTKYYPTKRNNLLMPTLIFYFLGDIAVFFSVPVGGVLYAFGHVFMLLAIVETTYIRLWQKIVFIVSLFIPIVALTKLVDQPLLLIVGLIYGAIIVAVMAFSLSNRYYWLAGIVFTLSDFTGLLRLQLMDNKYTYVVTTFIYFAAFFMLCISVFSIQRKEVVTWNDLFTMLKAAKQSHVRFWVCGSWALGIIKGNRRYSYEAIDVAYDVAQEDAFLMWLKHGRFEKEYGNKGLASRYYSEKYGTLRAYPCTFNEDGSAVMVTEKGHQLELDEGFFRLVRVLFRKVPCIVPGGIRQIKELLNEQQTENPDRTNR